MNGNPCVILTGALLAAGTAGIQAVLTTLGCGPVGIITSIAALLTTAITVLGSRVVVVHDTRTGMAGEVQEAAVAGQQPKQRASAVAETRVCAL